LAYLPHGANRAFSRAETGPVIAARGVKTAMSNKIGRFEILSELSHTEIGAVYKASDPESGQTIALKTIRPQVLGEHYAPLIQGVLEEATASQVLNSHNLTQLYGAQEMDGQFCAAMEYVQGNSVATMLARKEGFSIWDLQDIARQSCQGLDHAHVRNVVHYSLEPGKIMVSWDGTVKILSFGISRMSTFGCLGAGKAPEALHYMSPEQLRGETVDPRSNMFSLGAILYEMVTERKAFPGDDTEQVRQQILEQMPAPPSEVNRKLHPALSDVIMKALAKSPADRYQNGQELVNDLEKCKESPAKVAAKKPAASAPSASAPQQQKPVATVPSAQASLPKAPKPATEQKPVAATAVRASTVPQQKPVIARAESKTEGEFAVEPSAAVSAPAAAPEAEAQAPSTKPAEDVPATAAVPSWRAAAAGVGSSSTDLPRTPKLDSSEQFISTCVKASIDAVSHEQATMSAAAVKPEPVPPKIAVDPMMEADQGPGTRGPSFSEITELPPLKEVYVPPPPPEPEPVQSEPAPVATMRTSAAEKRAPAQQVAKQAAKKAVTEIKKTPPKLFMYSIAAAVGVILLVVVAIAYHIRSENEEDNPQTPAAVSAGSVPSQAASQPAPAVPAPVQAPAAVEAETAQPARRAAVSVTPKYNRKKMKPAVVSAIVVPGQLTINSTPEGAEISLDDRHDPTWVTPFNVSGLTPGQHLVKLSKAGFSTETRSIEVTSGGKSFVVVQLAQLTASISVTSDPTGAAVFIDGKDTGRLTPVQISVDRAGPHTLLVKKQGYLDETTTANLQAGQLLHFSPALRALGNTDDIKIGGGKFKKMFGGGGDTTGMGAVSVKTQPKGAQVAVNNRILDKLSPVEFHLNPGTYVIDITASGFKDIHRVINVEKGGKVAIDENMDRE